MEPTSNEKPAFTVVKKKEGQIDKVNLVGGVLVGMIQQGKLEEADYHAIKKMAEGENGDAYVPAEAVRVLDEIGLLLPTKVSHVNPAGPGYRRAATIKGKTGTVTEFKLDIGEDPDRMAVLRPLAPKDSVFNHMEAWNLHRDIPEPKLTLHRGGKTS